MRTISIFSIFSLLIVFISCEEPFSLDLRDSESKIVIEGLVADRPGYQHVKISRSGSFYSKGKTPRVTNAVVSVEDDLGNVFDFVHNPNDHEDSIGYYLPVTPFVGEMGRTYTLTVEADGKVYTASDKLSEVISMDSLKYDVNDFQFENPRKKDKYYELLIYAKEPQDEKNFYLFHFYRNDSLVFTNDTDIYYTDDKLVGENINGFPSPVYYGKGDKAMVQVFSLSRRGYVFYNDLWSVLNDDGGGMFGPVPSSPRTNLSNGALGFFQVSAISTESVAIE